MSRKILTFALSVLWFGAFIVACVAPAPTVVQPAATEMPLVQAATAAPPQGGISGSPAGTGEVRITIVYDNTGTTDPQLKPDWGFAAVVESGGHTLLFDTGGGASILLENLQGLGFDPSTIEAVILSHEHQDHTGGLQGLLDLGVKPTVYAPSKFLESFKQKVRAQSELVEVDNALEIVPGVHAIQPKGSIVEQALVLATREGAAMITGCAHPGIVEMVQAAREATGSEIAVLIGGFHLLNLGERKVLPIIAELRQLGVRRVLPTHCTGENAIRLFSTEYGENYIEGGVGRTVSFGAKD